MKILVSALACNPKMGSESHVGFAAVQCLARDHELWVLTSPRNQGDLESARAAGQIPDHVHFIYAGKFKPWHPHRLVAHLQGWKEYIHFTKAILPLAKRLHAEQHFEMAHHLTLVSWRVPCLLWKLNIPLIFGPVAGSDTFPMRFLPMLTPTTAGFEIVRRFSSTISSFSPAVRACIRNSAHVFAANRENAALIQRLRGGPEDVSCLLAYYHSAQGAQSSSGSAEKPLDGPLRFFAGGSLIGSKGVALVLRALARAKSQGVKFRYRFGGKGPEFAHIQELITRLGLQEEVMVGDALSGKDYHDELRASHCFLLPSLRESAGITLAEAMLAGCVPIVADCGGPGQMVTGECGYKLPISNPKALIGDMTRIIVEIDRNREILRKKGPAAAERIAQGFSEEHYRSTVNAVYAAVRQKKMPAPNE